MPVRRLALLALLVTACSRFGPVYPPRPSPSEGAPVADPEPSRVVAHLVVTSTALRQAIEDAAPRSGDGTIHVLGGDRRYTWERGPLDVALGDGHVTLRTQVHATLALPLKTLDLPLELRASAEPVVGSEYAVKLQSVDVHVTSTDTGLLLADKVAGVYGKIEAPIADRLSSFAYDLRPLLGEAYSRVAAPIDLPVGDAHACATLKVLEVEAGPTVLADGIEKDVALVVAPSITMPCEDGDANANANANGDAGDDAGTGTELHASMPQLPPLSNVATLQPGPFTVTIPIAARYDELTRAMTAAFTDGKLFFSKEYPAVYLEKPEIYESQGALVLRLHIAGPVHGLGIETNLDGDLFLVGHPAVVDNELRIPDLEPTIETRNLLLSLKAMTGADAIRDEARAALRLDIGARVREARAKLGDGLTFALRKSDACFRGDVDRVDVTGVYPHAAYLRVYVAVTARARAEMPCSAPVAH